MDAKTYATITEACARLAGRLSDDVLGTVREHYAAGEWYLAGSALLGNLAYQGVGITREEQGLIRSFLDEDDIPDLLDVPVVAEEPPLAYRFRPTGPVDAPSPYRADSLLTTHAAREGAQGLHRAWRDPLDGAPDGAAWLYVLRVAEDTDELKTFSGLTAVLWTDLSEKWPIEVVAEATALTPYQAAALAAAQAVWNA
ncbi:hypothetical protein [Micromonospora sp. NPDC093277]|uniref:hypothetical protein n=1 Tax=Micromonospora sp. NPDC093277 TaxID=3364291 RepID=UPI0037F98CCE